MAHGDPLIVINPPKNDFARLSETRGPQSKKWLPPKNFISAAIT
jgi:hypothetical protein